MLKRLRSAVTAGEDKASPYPELTSGVWNKEPVLTPGDDPEAESTFPLHRAVLAGDVSSVRSVVLGLSREERVQLDPQGQSALHLAVILGDAACVGVLLEAGLSPRIKSRQRWTPLDEAVARGDADMAIMLYRQQVANIKRELREKKAQLLETMQAMGDFSIQLRWELGSPILGLLLRRYAPSDTYLLRKLGARLRVDGSLRGGEVQPHSLLPSWKRGSFSLLVDASATPVSVLFVDRTRQRWVDLTKESRKEARDLEKEVHELLSEGAVKTRWQREELRFRRSRNWLGREATETVEGWDTQVYECSGRLAAVRHRKPAVRLPPCCTWAQYLHLELPPDQVEEVGLDPLAKPSAHSSRTGSFTGGGVPGSHPQVQHAQQGQQSGRKVAGKCWMAKDFPLSLRHLLPLLEVVGEVHKGMGRAANFLRRFSQQELFPVKLQVPLLWTVYLLLSFRDFAFLGPGREKDLSAQLFEVPEGYQEVSLEELRPEAGTHA